MAFSIKSYCKLLILSTIISTSVHAKNTHDLHGVKIEYINYSEKDNGTKYMEENSVKVHYYHDKHLINLTKDKQNKGNLALRLNSDIFVGGGLYKGSYLFNNQGFGSKKTTVSNVGVAITPYLDYQVTDDTQVQLGLETINQMNSMNRRYNFSLSALAGISQEYQGNKVHLKYGAQYKHGLYNKYYYPSLFEDTSVSLTRNDTKQVKLFVEKDKQYGLELSYRQSDVGESKDFVGNKGTKKSFYEPKDKEFGVGMYWQKEFN